jgi:hypothetical protein
MQSQQMSIWSLAFGHPIVHVFSERSFNITNIVLNFLSFRLSMSNESTITDKHVKTLVGLKTEAFRS